ncbi:hypothetical protein P3H15_55105, partial [Rhodococcus sp. T2V]|nr:hypothetical protein [Rhodococcus sp. T2V]
FPSFMKKVERVEQEADEKLEWKAQIFLSHRTWEASILEQVPDERIGASGEAASVSPLQKAAQGLLGTVTDKAMSTVSDKVAGATGRLTDYATCSLRTQQCIDISPAGRSGRSSRYAGKCVSVPPMSVCRSTCGNETV